MKKIIALLLTLVLACGLMACGDSAAEKTASPSGSSGTEPGSESSAPVYEDMGTILWLAHLSSGVQYDATVNYLTAICDALGYDFEVVYGDAYNDAANNLTAVQNAMSKDVVGLIASQDGGLASIMEEYPELWVAGYASDMRSVYDGGENAACLDSEKFLGTICDGFADGTNMGIQYADTVIERGYKKVAIVNFPAFAYANQGEAEIAFRSAIEEYNATASEPIEILGDTTTLMFEPLPDSWFLEAGRNELDCIVALCAGVQFVYPTMVSAKANGTCAAETTMITGGFDNDPNIVADIGDNKSISWITFGPSEDPAYAMILIDNAVTGNQYADFSAVRVDSAAYTIDSDEDINNVMAKSMTGTADVSLAQLSVEEVVAMCGRSDPDMTHADMIAVFQSISVDDLK